MDKIFDEYYYKIYNWSIKKTNNKEDAEDLTNTIFLAVFEYFNENIKVEKLENLIWKIAHNIWANKVKKYIKEKDTISYDDNISIGYEEKMLEKVIYKEIINNIENIGLTDKELTSFKLYYINDLSLKEISNKINSTENNIKYYLYNARKKIKERYYE